LAKTILKVLKYRTMRHRSTEGVCIDGFGMSWLRTNQRNFESEAGKVVENDYNDELKKICSESRTITQTTTMICSRTELRMVWVW